MSDPVSQLEEEMDLSRWLEVHQVTVKEEETMVEVIPTDGDLISYVFRCDSINGQYTVM